MELNTTPTAVPQEVPATVPEEPEKCGTSSMVMGTSSASKKRARATHEEDFEKVGR